MYVSLPQGGTMLVLYIVDLQKDKTNESRVLSIHGSCLINSRIVFWRFVVWWLTNRDTWNFIIQTIAAFLTAIATSLGVSICMGALKSNITAYFASFSILHECCFVSLS